MYIGDINDVRYDSARNMFTVVYDVVYDVVDGDDVVSSRELSWDASDLTVENIHREIHAGRIYLGATLGMHDHYPW